MKNLNVKDSGAVRVGANFKPSVKDSGAVRVGANFR